MRLTEDEEHILEKLADVWNLYTLLPVQHDMDQDEFCRAIHNIQNMVASRPTYRHMRGQNDFQKEIQAD